MPSMSYLESLRASEKYLETADHLAYVTIGVVKEKRLLLNVLENIYKAVLYAMNAVLQFESERNQIKTYKESSKNMGVFKIVSDRYGINNEELRMIDEIMLLTKKHKESKMEFVRGEKMVLMENDKVVYFDLPKIKQYISGVKMIVAKVRNGVEHN
jgi:hypothetical protein